MELKRVVITGMGAVTPLGNSVEDYWQGLVNGVSGAALITSFDTSKFKTKFACTLKDFDPTDYLDRKEVENVLQEKLQTIPGISAIQIWGEKRYAMRLWLNPNELAAYSLTPQDVLDALNRENVDLPSGKLSGNATELTVRTFGQLKTEDDFNNMIIKNVNGNIIRFRNIGKLIFVVCRLSFVAGCLLFVGCL